MSQSIAIIGGGNLGQAIASGLLSENFDPSNLTITRHKTHLLQTFADQGVRITKDNNQAVQDADTIIIAVKPYRISEVLQGIKTYISNDKLIISVVSDYSIEQMQNDLDSTPIIFRAMPNTASSVNESMTCIASNNGSESHTETVKSIFNALGETIVINEQLMDAATVLGACGIAYVLRFIRGMIQGGIEIGFDAQTATKIATQTVKGASELLLQEGNHPEAEIDKVTTPKGCTIAGLNEMEHQGFSSALIKGIKTSYDNISD
ncbi:pyrroline-5-carboxylate reductase [Psychroserpens sp.]|uniref:pyrroline-5-carboxylate reductase n=1 Tax=Psychroserpens sp. TaxID=2020870 RepID=UPI001B27636F|nr:pyrroline-5-carboxylate reductase [Psychroserpens sp.]MBO6606174.1 pyrroline-5-carboxylate reductase [Psychroserpens sp.]MBO6652454.1 pyrroline-5-carboxylate reductase [Psychroserpens sp.]MBO6681774.1 pyrroline-5-carboxylate reductase [Psychroserpens sp.]MBO6749549.1 pyrroline-5-carboxylate reductase [Psychroserpens sp.]MBO6914006.1 pyrroline-5-carboxylate reductase [Psychroserpens sp.]